jgi:hypothetical protein
MRPEHLNDDRLGRVLDKLFDADPNQIFINLAPGAARHFGVCTESVHLDATGLTPDEWTISAYANAASSIVACSYSDGLR